MTAPVVALPFDPTGASFLTSADNPALPTLDPTAPDTTPVDTTALTQFYSSPTSALGGSAGIPQVSNITAGDTSSAPDLMSGLGSIFGAVGTAVTQTYRAVNAPTGPTVLRPGVGGLVYNPATGQYVSQTGFPVGMGSNTLFLIVLIAIAFLVFRK
jgi:hypothetical protein